MAIKLIGIAIGLTTANFLYYKDKEKAFFQSFHQISTLIVVFIVFSLWR